jgi:hypothetical protein
VYVRVMPAGLGFALWFDRFVDFRALVLTLAGSCTNLRKVIIFCCHPSFAALARRFFPDHSEICLASRWRCRTGTTLPRLPVCFPLLSWADLAATCPLSSPLLNFIDSPFVFGAHLLE